MMKRTISGMIGAGSLAHNRRDFVAENVDPDRVQLNICYQNENLLIRRVSLAPVSYTHLTCASANWRRFFLYWTLIIGPVDQL